jgi:hypothetical protein
MDNLSGKLLAINEISNEIFGGEMGNTYVISVWDKEITFSSHYKKEIAAKAIAMDGAKVEVDSSGFSTITFKHFDLSIVIVLS